MSERWVIFICQCGSALGEARMAIKLKTCPDCGRSTVPIEDRAKRVTVVPEQWEGRA